MNTASNVAALALPAAPVSPAVPAARRRSPLRAVRRQASLLTTLTLLGSSAAYCVYALGSIAR